MKLDLAAEPEDSFADTRIFQNIGKFHLLPANFGELAFVFSPLPPEPACLKTTPAV
jgi:hypothetical protein